VEVIETKSGYLIRLFSSVGAASSRDRVAPRWCSYRKVIFVSHKKP